MNIFVVFVTISMSLILCQVSHAKSEIIHATFKYTLGDNDSKNDARRLAFLEAKRSLIEKAGVFVESSTSVVDSALTSDEIKTYSGAIIKTELEKESFETVNGVQILTVHVKASIDPDDVLENLKKIRDDKKLQKKIKVQQKQIDEMQNKLHLIHKQIEGAKGEKALDLRSKRSNILSKMTELEKIAYEVETMSTKVKRYVRNGMTEDDVNRVAGSGRIKYHWNILSPTTTCINYGDVWVILCNHLVCGYVGSSEFIDCSYKNLSSNIVKFDKLYQ